MTAMDTPHRAPSVADATLRMDEADARFGELLAQEAANAAVVHPQTASGIDRWQRGTGPVAGRSPGWLLRTTQN